MKSAREIISDCRARRYSAGTLQYSAFGVISVSFWLLWGAFWYEIIEYVLVPTLLPLQYKSFGASGTLMGVMLGSVPALLNFVVNPIISTASDATRSKYGRRIPYLAASIPFLASLCIMIGWIPEISEWMAGFSGADKLTVGLVLLCVVSALFYFCSLFIGAIGCYLPPDVIPSCFIGRYMVAARLVSSAAGFLFNYFLMKYATSHSKEIFTGLGLAFAFCYTVMVLKVKEGEYPPPPKPEGTPAQRLGTQIKGYFTECFCNRFYLILFLGIAITQVSTQCRGIFNILFATKDLALTTEQYGQINAVGSLAVLAATFLCFFWIDKVNPLLVFIASNIPILILNVYGYYGVHDYSSFYIVGVLIVIAYSVQNLSFVPMLIKLLPKEKFGQYSSANAMMCCILRVVTSYFCGLAVDRFGNRFIYVWDFVFTVFAALILLESYRLTRRQEPAAVN